MGKRKISLYILAIGTIFVAVFGATYAFIDANITNNTSSQASIQTAGNLVLSLDDVDGINHVEETVIKSFEDNFYLKVENQGIADYVKLTFVNLINTFVTDTLVYSLEEVDSNKTSLSTPNIIVDNEAVPKSSVASTRTLANHILIPANTTKYYKVTISYDTNSPIRQNDDIGKTISSRFGIEQGYAMYDQIVNYQLLYDGSLGDSIANQMTSVTGGWYFDASGNYSGVAENDRLQITYSGGNGQGYWRMTNNISLSGYNKYGLVYTRSQTSFSTEYGFKLSDNTSVGTGDRGPLTTKKYKLEDFNANTNGAFYFGYGVTSALYEVFILKPDNYNMLASKAHVNVESIDDLLNNYSSQLLNNEEIVEYMINQCTGDFMATAVKNSSFMSAYQNSIYKNRIDENPHWSKFLSIANNSN